MLTSECTNEYVVRFVFRNVTRHHLLSCALAHVQVEDVFSSATHIPSQLAPVSAKMLDVNFVARIFQLIVSAHESVAKAFSQALSKLLSHFGSGSLAPANNNSLRVRLTAVISLAFGALMDPSNFSTVVQPLCSEISRYSDEDRKLFVSIWQKVRFG